MRAAADGHHFLTPHYCWSTQAYMPKVKRLKTSTLKKLCDAVARDHCFKVGNEYGICTQKLWKHYGDLAHIY
eukprot:2972461-Pleurochrysis_carterae.AAC.1